MKDEEIQTIIEGCYPDTPRRLLYYGVKEDMPKNAQILQYDHEYHPIRYILFATTTKFKEDITIVHNPYFPKRAQPSKKLTGGIVLNERINNFNWIMDAQRSLTTRDGRVYIDAHYFTEGWRWYLSAVPTIIKECGQIFRGEKSTEELAEKPSSAW